MIAFLGPSLPAAEVPEPFEVRPPARQGDIWRALQSRPRVIALIDSLKQHDPDAFAEDKIGDDTPIANAFIVITGEPMTPVGDEAVA